METINCPSCNVQNTTADDACKQCGESLAAAKLQHSIDEINKATAKMRELTTPRKSFYSINGCGTMLLDYRALSDGTFEAVRWVTIIGLPIIPLEAYVIEPESQEHTYGRETSKFSIVRKTSLSLARIFRTYGLAVVALLPIVVGSLNSSWINRTLGGPLAALAMLLAIVWGGYLIFFRLKNDSKAYKKKPTHKSAHSV
ncbi:MAG: hypothetical protein DMF69_06825 [Acidobacteria bacterium]|nr:MAG: hypothetical protein DMF69_06825 [Acidobacteriota bacterium]